MPIDPFVMLRLKLLRDIEWHCEAYLTGADTEFLRDVNPQIPAQTITDALAYMVTKSAIELRYDKYYPRGLEV